MRVLIDADGCPVVKAAIRLCREFSVPCTLFCDTAHFFHDDYADTIVCDKGADSVDYKIANRIFCGDLCITQDYGLAAMCLSRGAMALHQDGMVYTDDNIGGLLEARAFSGKVRRGGGRLKGPPKRTEAQNQAFAASLRRILEAHCGTGRNP